MISSILGKGQFEVAWTDDRWIGSRDILKRDMLRLEPDRKAPAMDQLVKSPARKRRSPRLADEEKNAGAATPTDRKRRHIQSRSPASAPSPGSSDVSANASGGEQSNSDDSHGAQKISPLPLGSPRLPAGPTLGPTLSEATSSASEPQTNGSQPRADVLRPSALRLMGSGGDAAELQNLISQPLLAAAAAKAKVSNAAAAATSATNGRSLAPALLRPLPSAVRRRDRAFLTASQPSANSASQTQCGPAQATSACNAVVPAAVVGPTVPTESRTQRTAVALVATPLKGPETIGSGPSHAAAGPSASANAQPSRKTTAVLAAPTTVPGAPPPVPAPPTALAPAPAIAVVATDKVVTGTAKEVKATAVVATMGPPPPRAVRSAAAKVKPAATAHHVAIRLPNAACAEPERCVQPQTWPQNQQMQMPMPMPMPMQQEEQRMQQQQWEQRMQQQWQQSSPEMKRWEQHQLEQQHFQQFHQTLLPQQQCTQQQMLEHAQMQQQKSPSVSQQMPQQTYANLPHYQTGQPPQPMVNRRSPMVNRRSPIVNRRSPIVNRRSRTDCTRSPIVNRRSSIWTRRCKSRRCLRRCRCSPILSPMRGNLARCPSRNRRPHPWMACSCMRILQWRPRMNTNRARPPCIYHARRLQVSRWRPRPWITRYSPETWPSTLRWLLPGRRRQRTIQAWRCHCPLGWPLTVRSPSRGKASGCKRTRKGVLMASLT